MNYTISDMLRDNLIPGIEQLAYGGDLGAAEIAEVMVQEYPADDFVQPGDLVLSTAEGCTENEEKFAAFLDELADSGACGVLFAFRNPDYRFPLSLRLRAQKRQLPVFRIPWKVRFAQVQSDLIRLIHRKNVEYLTEYKIKNDFVWSLAFSDREDPQQMAEQGRRLKFDLSLHYACLRFRVTLTEDSQEHSVMAAEAAAAVERSIEAAARVCGLHAMYAALSLDFLIYIQVREGRESEDTALFIGELREMLQSIRDVEIVYGLGPAIPGQAADFRKLAEQAGVALQYAQSSPQRFYTYKDAKEAALITALLRDESAVSISRQTLEPLLAEDRKGSRYVETLAAYFRCCGNATKAAEALHIHRISLLQRLEKIEAITGLSLKDHRDRLLLQLCVRMILDF